MAKAVHSLNYKVRPIIVWVSPVQSTLESFVARYTDLDTEQETKLALASTQMLFIS